MKTIALIIIILIFGQLAFGQTNSTLPQQKEQVTFQKFPPVLERKELFQNINYREYSNFNKPVKQFDPNIKIRICSPSRHSLNSEPLYIIDGKEIANGNSLKIIDPHNIESVSIVKDAISAKQYGDKGKNGVIIIIMRKK